MLYDSDMLEDLDHLSERLTKLVAYTHQINTERQALLSRVKSALAERDAQAQLHTHDGQQTKALQIKVRAYESEIENLRTQSIASHAALQASLDALRQENRVLEVQLAERAHEVTALRAATIQAKERIDAVLERLPGAQPLEQT